MRQKGNKKRADGDLRTKIFSILKLIKTPKAFACSGECISVPNPALCIPPHGIIGLPLSTNDAQNIISQASQSPVSKGEETLINTAVHKRWELNPDQFSLKNPAWNKEMEEVLDIITTRLGLEKQKGMISAELHKLLLYEPGAFLKPHKDNRKAPGMFATLVVCLPSPHEGGKLVLTHNTEKYEFETASSSAFNYSYAMWYSDITYEVLPVVTGYRLILIYNLIRQTGVEIPSYNLVCRHQKQLLTLLEEYNSRLEAKDDKLPPFLLHKLERKYKQAGLKCDTLIPSDLAQVQALAQLSTKFWSIYLATAVLKVDKDDDEDAADYEKKSRRLENIVELDGKLVVEKLDYSNGALIDPTPQDIGKADHEKHQPFSAPIDEGRPATYWYWDTVVVLIPPSKRLNFVFKFKSYGPIIDPLFSKLLQEFSKDPAQKRNLEQLCELAVKHKPEKSCYYSSQSSKSTPSYIQQAAVTALDLNRMDLFDEACKTTEDEIIVRNARMLGCWAAKHGLVTMTERLMKGVRVATSVADSAEFLKSVAEGFELAVPKPNDAERVSLKQWLGEAIFTVVAELKKLTEDDYVSLARLCKIMDWSQFESKVKPIILKEVITTKITFIKELMSTLQQKPDEKQRLFIKMIILDIWNEFAFDIKCCESMSPSYSGLQRRSEPVYLERNYIHHIVENSITILSSKCIETTIIPAMLTAIPTTVSKECTKYLFPTLVRMILSNELPGFNLKANEAAPPHLHKRLVQAFLTKFLIDHVSHEPQPPANWSLCHGRCNCNDCIQVNRFLEDPCKESSSFTFNKTRLAHINRIFTESTYDVRTTSDYVSKNKLVFFWEITKNRQNHKAAMSEWKGQIKYAIEVVDVAETYETVAGRLKAYLEPYYNIMKDANIKELPNLESLITTPELSEPSKNTAAALNQPTRETGYKREASDIHPLEDGLAKRTKS